MSVDRLEVVAACEKGKWVDKVGHCVYYIAILIMKRARKGMAKKNRFAGECLSANIQSFESKRMRCRVLSVSRGENMLIRQVSMAKPCRAALTGVKLVVLLLFLPMMSTFGECIHVYDLFGYVQDVRSGQAVVDARVGTVSHCPCGGIGNPCQFLWTKTDSSGFFKIVDPCSTRTDAGLYYGIGIECAVTAPGYDSILYQLFVDYFTTCPDSTLIIQYRDTLRIGLLPIATSVEESQTETFAVKDPIDFKLFPNPFNANTTMQLELSTASQVVIVIYDVLGHPVKRLANDWFSSGLHRYEWDGRDQNSQVVTSGVYFCRATIGDESITRKLVLLK